MSKEEKLSFEEYLEISKQNAVKEVDNLIDLPNSVTLSIYHRLHLAKQEIGKINKSADNPFFKSKYADLNTILDVVEPILHKHGLILLQPIKSGLVQSVVIDIETGIEIVSEIKLPEITDPQKLGGCISYFRRYSLQSLLSLSMQDDDANEVTKHVNKPTISNERFEKAIIAVNDGKAKKEDLFKFQLTDLQKSALQLL